MISLIIAANLLTAMPAKDAALYDQADTAEINSYYDDNGCLVFRQVIYIDADNGTEQIVAWRMVKTEQHRPTRDFNNGGYVATFQDGEHMRRIRVKHLRETWLQYDPEVAAREYFPIDQRRGLKKWL